PTPTATPASGTTTTNTTPSNSTPPSTGGATAATSLSGTWSANVEFGQTPIPVTFVLQQQGADLTGRIESRFGSSDIGGGSVTGNNFRFATTLDLQGQSVSFNFEGTASGNTMNGTVITPRGQVPFTGTRNP
ncbi:MAG: hypothetical protein WCD76_04165, partial [Pyrinomonadaceae bacterium]